MSSVSERQRALILDLLLGRTTEEAFLKAFPVERGQASAEGLAILRAAARSRDSLGVEMGLHMGHFFGISPEYLDVLCELAIADWHERHEDVVDALATLKSASSVDALYGAATSRHPYRAYDEALSLGQKAIRALGRIGTADAIEKLRELRRSDRKPLATAAEEALERANAG